MASAAPSQPTKAQLRYVYIAKGRYYRFRHPSTGDVPLPDDLDHPASYRAYSKLLRQRASTSDRLLLTRTGKPYDKRVLAKDLRNAMREAGLPAGLTMHGLRYAAVDRLVDMGCNVQAIIAVTGHRCYEMAIKYLNTRKSAVQASNAMDAHDLRTVAAATRIANPISKVRTPWRIINDFNNAGLAQLVEHLICNQGVAGSIPAAGTTVTLRRATRRGTCRG